MFILKEKYNRQVFAIEKTQPDEFNNFRTGNKLAISKIRNMINRINHLSLLNVLAIVFASLFVNSTVAQTNQNWQIIVPVALQQEESIKVVIEDLQSYGKDIGITFHVNDDTGSIKSSAIIVGDAATNKKTNQFLRKNEISLEGVDDPQGYEIISIKSKKDKVILISGGSVIGNVYGLYWMWDRMRVYKEIPDINVIRTPALQTRMSLAWGRRAFGGGSEETMQQALRQSINWVSGAPIIDLVPWNSEPEKGLNAENRARTKELIEYAHTLNMKYFCFANEFTYHPSLLVENNAILSPCDPNFWDALQDKYRKLFTALPELDGIEVCNDDISGFWDDYRGYDLMHKGENCDMPYAKRFQTFVNKLSEVVIDEYDKTYFHFTWSLVSHEQHYSAEVFRDIFDSEEVRVDDNLFLIPKITAGDRWWHQPYNPTFNQSPHQTLVAFETMNYYEGGGSNIFPTFSGQYFQGGLQTFLSPDKSNVKGAGFLVNSSKKGWDTPSAYSYVLYRLSWNPYEDINQIAEDFAAINFGKDVAKSMSEIYLMTPVAYKYGLHIEPISYGRFNSFIHMRVNVFPAMGYPQIDGGREHMEFLEKIYLRSKPWQFETLDDLDHGLETAKKMVTKYKEVKPQIEDKELATELENRLNMTRWLIETNNAYVKTTFDYFSYRENPNNKSKQKLIDSYERLINAKKNFMNTPGFGYKLFGVNLLIKNASFAIANVENAEEILNSAPTAEQLEKTITDQQELYKTLLKKYKEESVKLLHIEVKVDGRDLLIVNDDQYKIKNLRYDGAHVQKLTFFAELPKEEVTVIPLDIHSRPMHPFILEQPNAENGYTVTVYMYDKPGADGIMEFELYYLAKSPKEVGLDLPWKN